MSFPSDAVVEPDPMDQSDAELAESLTLKGYRRFEALWSNAAESPGPQW